MNHSPTDEIIDAIIKHTTLVVEEDTDPETGDICLHDNQNNQYLVTVVMVNGKEG